METESSSSLEQPERPAWMPDVSDAAETPTTEPSAGASPPEGYISRAEYDRLADELEEVRSRGRETPAWGNEAHQRLAFETAVRGEVERLYRDHMEASQRAAQMQPPQPQAVEEWLVEPSQIASYVGQYGGWVRDTLLAQLAPFLQRLAMYDSVLPSVLGRAAEDSLARAKQMLEAEGVTDFDELRPEIEQAFGAHTQGARLILDPPTVASVYHYLSRQRSPRPVRETSKPVPTAGKSTPSGRTGAAPAASAALRQVAERLQVPVARLAERLAKRSAA